MTLKITTSHKENFYEKIKICFFIYFDDGNDFIAIFAHTHEFARIG